MYHSFYMFLALSFLGVFAVVLLLREFRGVALWTALACAPAGIIGEIWLIPKYWNPPYLVPLAPFPFRFGIEDLILTGAFAGICAAAFEYAVKNKGYPETPPVTARTFLAMEGYGLFGFVIMICSMQFLNLEAIHSLFLSILVILLVMARSCLMCMQTVLPVAAAIACGYMVYLAAVVTIFFPGAIAMFWNIGNMWGIYLGNLPLEELVWAFLTAVYCGLIYRIAATAPFPLGIRYWQRVLHNSTPDVPP